MNRHARRAAAARARGRRTGYLHRVFAATDRRVAADARRSPGGTILHGLFTAAPVLMRAKKKENPNDHRA
jgi:hypothetical protein